MWYFFFLRSGDGDEDDDCESRCECILVQGSLDKEVLLELGLCFSPEDEELDGIVVDSQKYLVELKGK